MGISQFQSVYSFFRAIRGGHVLISADGISCLSGFRYACPIVLNGKWQRSLHSFPSTTERNLNFLSPELLEQNLHGMFTLVHSEYT